MFASYPLVLPVSLIFFVWFNWFLMSVIPTVTHVPMWSILWNNRARDQGVSGVVPKKGSGVRRRGHRSGIWWNFRPGGLSWFTCCGIHPYQLELSPISKYIWSNYIYICYKDLSFPQWLAPSALQHKTPFPSVRYCTTLPRVGNAKTPNQVAMPSWCMESVPKCQVTLCIHFLAINCLVLPALLVFRIWFSHLIIYSCFETLRVLFDF